jgi:RimJ/RimL family protein N-acetyltransferase
MRLVFGADKEVADWVAAQIPHLQGGSFGPCSAIGVVDNEILVAGVVYHDYQQSCKTIQLSMMASTPRWAQRGIVRALLHYPFMQIGVQKVWTTTPHTNERAIRFNKGIGFKQEAVLARHFGEAHAVICRMFRKDYERLFMRKDDGQKSTGSSATA